MERLAEALFRRIEAPAQTDRPEQIRIEPRLIIRESTAGRADCAADDVETLEEAAPDQRKDRRKRAMSADGMAE